MKVSFLLFFLTLLSQNLWAYKVVFIGDSLTEGYSLAKTSAYPYLIEQKLLAIAPNSKVINAGVSGATSQSAVSQVKWYVKTKPDLIVIALGANDGLRGLPIKQLKSNLSEAIKLAQKETIKVVIAGMKLPSNYGQKYRENFEKVYPELAQEFNLILIPFLLDKIALVPELNLSDRIHPNEKGHQIIAETVWPYVKKALEITK
jgi:acyl-CoA thioesterase-1